MKIRDRIKELRRVKASELVPNPKNWRMHPEHQQNALRGILAEVGIADAVLARELPDGRLMLIDGHLRAETTPGAKLPVLVLDVDEAEADKLLAVLDPLAGMADANVEQMQALYESLDMESTALQDMLEALAAGEGFELSQGPAGGEGEGGEGDEGGEGKPDLGGGLGEPVVQYTIVFDTEEQQREWFAFLRYIKAKYPDCDSNGARISSYLRDAGLAAAE